jgi:hypothetical protein
MDVRTGCTTRARVQQKLTQNKQVYSVKVGILYRKITCFFVLTVLKYPLNMSFDSFDDYSDEVQKKSEPKRGKVTTYNSALAP